MSNFGPRSDHRSELFVFSFALCCSAMLALPESRADVLTYHYDSQRTGLNPAETGLNPTSVSSLEQQWSVAVDGDVYAQPLYLSSVVINGARHNELIVATENDSVYALDADTGITLWKTSLIPSGSGERPVHSNELGLHNNQTCTDLPGNIGITGTPVIDRFHNKIFAVAYTITSSGHKLYRLHSLNLLTGQDTASPEIGGVKMPVTFPGTFPAVDTSGGLVHFNAAEERQRPGLLLVNGIVYVGFGSFCDSPPFTGWILAFDENSLALVGTLDTNPTAAGNRSGSFLPDGSGGGVWNPGALATPANNSFIYTVTGNGPWNGMIAAVPPFGTFGDSILKLNLKTLSIVDYFTPFDEATDQAQDRDLGSGGPVALDIKDNAGVNHKLVVVAGKDKEIYVANRSNLGKQVKNPPNGGIVADGGQFIGPIVPSSIGVFGPGAFLNGAMYWGPAGKSEGAGFQPILKFVFSNAKLVTSPATSTITFPVLGTVPVTSAFINSAGVVSGGLVWAIALTSPGATLYAFDPGNLNTRFTSTALMPATLGAKFNVPTIANSKVYLGTRGAVYAFAGSPNSSNTAKNIPLTNNSNVKLTQGAFVNGAGGLVTQTVMVTNTGTTPLFTTPLSLVLDGLSTNATLVSASGATTYQMPLVSPYQHFALSGPLPAGSSVSLTLQFFNSTTGLITYTPRLLDGPGYR